MPTPPTTEPLRPDRIDLYEGLNKVTLVPGTAAPGKRGKGIGFYCAACNLTYRDSIQYLDHLNSKQHQYATGVKDSNVPVATLEDVRNRLKMLKEKQAEQEQARGPEYFDIQQRIARRKQVEEEERLAKQKARAEKRKRQQKKRKREDEDSGEQDDEHKRQAQDMAAMMGFSNFGSSKA